MSTIHSIRLHGPWIVAVGERFAAEAPSTGISSDDSPVRNSDRRLKIPSDWGQWLGASFRGRVDFQRNFNLPTQLAPDQKVWLVVDQVDYRGKIFLNERPLGVQILDEHPFRCEIQNHLLANNCLRIEIELPPDVDRGERNLLPGGLIGGVRLEIEES